MMDLTPLDVRKKKGDFRRGIRGYEQAQVDDFLELVADRMEVLVREASSVGDRIARLEQQVAEYRDREKALTEALVTAQQMREDIRTQSTREVEILRKQAEQEADRIRAEAVRMRDREEQALEGLRSRQHQFLASYRKYLEQELSELAAMAQGLEMHNGGSHRGAAGYPGAVASRSTPFEMPSAAPLAASGHADTFRGANGPAAGPVGSPSGSEPGFAGPTTPATPAAFAPSATQAAPAASAPSTTPATPAAFATQAPVEPPSTPPSAVSPERAMADARAHPVSETRVEAPASNATAVSPVAGPPAASVPSADTVEGPEAQLEEALARWEPELGPEPELAVVETDEAELELEAADDAGEASGSAEEFGSAAEVELELEAGDETGLEFEPAGGAGIELDAADGGLEFESGGADIELDTDVPGLEFESADEADLLLSADDEIAAVAQSAAQPAESEDDVDLAFLEFGEDDVAEAEDAAVAAAAAEAMERDVSAAMVESPSDYIDIGTALGEEPDDFELPVEAIAEVSEAREDEAEAAIDAAFNFDDGKSDGLTETQMSGPRVSTSSPAGESATPSASEARQAEALEPDDDLAADIEFVDSLLMDAESVFEEGPSTESEEDVAASSGATMDPFGDAEFEDIAAEDDRSDENGTDRTEGGSGDLIDLDSYRGFSTYEPPAPSTGDVSSLTLHPMFFEQEPSELDGDEHEESRQDHWSS